MFDFFLFSKAKSDLRATVPASTEAGFDRRGIRSVDLVRRAFDRVGTSVKEQVSYGELREEGNLA